MEQKVNDSKKNEKKHVRATAASNGNSSYKWKTMMKRWRKIGFYIIEVVRCRVKKKVERKRGRTKIIACKHSEIKHDSIMIWYIDMKQNKNQVARGRKRRNNERNMRPKCGAKFCVSIHKESTKSTLSCCFFVLFSVIEYV